MCLVLFSLVFRVEWKIRTGYFKMEKYMYFFNRQSSDDFLLAKHGNIPRHLLLLGYIRETRCVAQCRNCSEMFHTWIHTHKPDINTCCMFRGIQVRSWNEKVQLSLSFWISIYHDKSSTISFVNPDIMKLLSTIRWRFCWLFKILWKGFFRGCAIFLNFSSSAFVSILWIYIICSARTSSSSSFGILVCIFTLS